MKIFLKSLRLRICINFLILLCSSTILLLLFSSRISICNSLSDASLDICRALKDSAHSSNLPLDANHDGLSTQKHGRRADKPVGIMPIKATDLQWRIIQRICPRAVPTDGPTEEMRLRYRVLMFGEEYSPVTKKLIWRTPPKQAPMMILVTMIVVMS